MLKKEYKELKNKIGEYFEKKELYTWEYEELSTLINKIKFDNPLLFEHYMGKLEYIKKSYIESQEHFNNAIKINHTFGASYLYLYKIEVIKRNYEDAYNYLKEYKKYIPSSNITLYESSLKQILDLKNNEVKEYNVEMNFKYLNKEIYDENIKNHYKKIIEFYNKKDFINMKDEVENLNIYLKQTLYPIEVDTLKRLINELIIMYKNNINYLLNEKMPVQKIIDIINLYKIPKEKLYIILDKIVDNNYNDFYKIIDNINIENKIYEISFLKNKAFEYETYNNYDSKTKKKYEEYIDEASKYYKEKDYDKALDIYLEAYNRLNNITFLYYIGKIYFKCKNYYLCSEYLNKYIDEKGALKLEKALLYLYNSDYRLGKKDKAIKNIKKLKRINKSFNRNFKIYPLEDKEEHSCDIYKKCISKKLQMKEFNFEEYDELLDLKKFEEYNFRQKLQLIKYLYQKGNIKTAQLYLKKINASNDLEKEELNQFNKNKILYKNKHR